MTYDENIIRPMREEMTGSGFREAHSAEDVDRVFAEEGPMLFFINSVCGCAAGVARPAVLASLNQSILPNNLVTAFAGNDVEAVNRARQLFAGYPPSSPCAAIVRDGRVMHMVERHHIEGQSAESVAQILQSAYDKYCGAEIDESVDIFDPVAALQITQQEARERLSANRDIAVLDVRDPQEISTGKIEGAIEVDQVKAQEIFQTWPRDREIIVYCQHGKRSLQAAHFFRSHGFENIKSLAGGYATWTASS